MKFIRDDIPPVKVPIPKGTYYEALVPDTPDMAERARLFVENYLPETTIPEMDYEPHYGAFYDLIPPRITRGWGNYVCSWPKFRESLPLMRIMIGNKKGTEIDKAWAEHVLKCIGPDGLFYIPTEGRPWDKSQAYPWVGEFLSAKYYTYLPTVNGRLLGALAIYYRITGDEIWNETAKRIVDRMDALAVKVGDMATFPRFLFLPNEKVSPEEIQKTVATMREQTGDETERNLVLWQTWIVVGLAQYYRISAYEPAKALAYRLVNFIRDCRFVEEWQSHFHCISLGIHAMLELAYAAQDMELARYAQKAYDVAKSGKVTTSLPSIGYFAHYSGEHPMESCSIADMTAIAVKLAQLGIGDWEDVDRYARNCLIEGQLTNPHQLRDFCQKLQDSGRAKQVPLETFDMSDRLAERMVGSFSSHLFPNDLFGSALYCTCCTGNCSRALYYVWESILSYDDRELKINLLLNRASPWADVDSHIPYTGGVDIKIKAPCKSVKVRMNSWIDKNRIACKVKNEDQAFSWDDDYLVLGNAEAGQTIRIEFPIPERTLMLETFGHRYEATFKGNDCIDIAPKGSNHPLFQRDYYRSSQTKFISVERFACDKPLKW